MWAAFVKSDSVNFFKLFTEKIWNFKDVDQSIIVLPLIIYISNYQGRLLQAVQIKSELETLGDYMCKNFPTIVSKKSQFYEIGADYQKLKVYCHGIECDLNIPLLYFYKNFYYFDGFTYLVIKF